MDPRTRAPDRLTARGKKGWRGCNVLTKGCKKDEKIGEGKLSVGLVPGSLAALDVGPSCTGEQPGL